MDTPLLWHIPLSHFNEKVRWSLDYKGIAHRRRVLGPDYLIRAWRATGRGTLPILFLDGRAIGDSTRIIEALEQRYPQPPLYPRDTEARQRTLALEDYFDEQLGPALRAATVTPLFRRDPYLALRVLTTGMLDKAYQRLRPLVRIFPAFYRFRHKISDANLEADRATVAAALDRIEQERQGRTYLVGDTFTVADLTAAAMLSPLAQPPEIQYPMRVELPPYLQEYRAALLCHPAAQWTLDIYRKHRGRSAEVRPKLNDHSDETRDYRPALRTVFVRFTSTTSQPHACAHVFCRASAKRTSGFQSFALACQCGCVRNGVRLRAAGAGL